MLQPKKITTEKIKIVLNVLKSNYSSKISSLLHLG